MAARRASFSACWTWKKCPPWSVWQAVSRRGGGRSLPVTANSWTYGYGSIPIDTFLMGWTSIYQLFWGSLGTRVLTHSHIWKKEGWNHWKVGEICWFLLAEWWYPGLSWNWWLGRTSGSARARKNKRRSCRRSISGPGTWVRQFERFGWNLGSNLGHKWP